MQIPFPTILLALGATAAVFNPVAAHDAVAARDPVAVFDPVAALDLVAADAAVLDRRGNNPFKKLKCTLWHALQVVLCQTMAQYKSTCLLVAEVNYNFCRNRAANEVPNDDDKCPPACEAQGKTCVAVCDKSTDAAGAKACIERCLAAAGVCCGAEVPT
ncbi:hypothetical protein CKM354_000785600 [Cercospora kikuchii]|uniref:Uncharacterized protein n=1 Tax=Cercospora kikuchii TaxID=84275 RepID=A0A9P3CRY2_9PEZI|nr:uncharacterized protein CKM354_000785600 [Cercospora kikuchii]GIZ44665.1 hypothetical protein CKM354_000785600 [Cercospora kikuchii]